MKNSNKTTSFENNSLPKLKKNSVDLKKIQKYKTAFLKTETVVPNPDVLSINHEEAIEAEKEKLKYKMGVFLKNSKIVKPNFQILLKRYWWRILMVFVASLVFNLGVSVFLRRAQTIPSGVSGIPTLINYIFTNTKQYFSLIYLAINVPVFLIFGRKVKKSFIVLTLLFMIFQIFVQLIISQTPLEQFFNDNFVLTNTLKDANEFDNDPTNLLYTMIGASLIGIGISLSWKAGGSTGGTDIIGYYFSMKSKKNIGFTLSIIGYLSAIVFLVIFYFVNPNVVKTPDGKTSKKIIFGVREISTFIYVFVINYVVDLIYPKYKKVTLTIISNTPDKILAYFKLIEYWHSYRIERFKSGYTEKQGVKITTSVLILESTNLIHDLKYIDKNIWISMTDERKIVGKFNTNYVE